MIELLRDVLDTQVLDRRGTPIGRVDDVALELRDAGPPRVAFLELGGTRRWRRLHAFFEALARAARELWPGRNRPTRLAWSQVKHLGIDIEADIDAEDAPNYALEKWLRDRVIGRIPGAH